MGWISMERFNDNGAAKVNLFRIWRWHVFIHTLIKFGLFLDPHQCASMAQMHYARQALERMEHFFIWKNSYIMLLRGLFVVKFRFSCHFNWIEERAWIRLLFSVSPVINTSVAFRREQCVFSRTEHLHIFRVIKMHFSIFLGYISQVSEAINVEEQFNCCVRRREREREIEEERKRERERDKIRQSPP